MADGFTVTPPPMMGVSLAQVPSVVGQLQPMNIPGAILAQATIQGVAAGQSIGENIAKMIYGLSPEAQKQYELRQRELGLKERQMALAEAEIEQARAKIQSEKEWLSRMKEWESQGLVRRSPSKPEGWELTDEGLQKFSPDDWNKILLERKQVGARMRAIEELMPSEEKTTGLEEPKQVEEPPSLPKTPEQLAAEAKATEEDKRTFAKMFPKAAKDMQRADGTIKGAGFFGPLPTKGGKVMTEVSVGVEMNGVETQIPTLVPGLTKEELSYLSDGGDPRKNPSIMQKARAHAEERMKKGLSPFAAPEEEGQSEIPGAGLTTPEGQFIPSAPMAETFEGALAKVKPFELMEKGALRGPPVVNVEGMEIPEKTDNVASKEAEEEEVVVEDKAEQRLLSEISKANRTIALSSMAGIETADTLNAKNRVKALEKQLEKHYELQMKAAETAAQAGGPLSEPEKNMARMIAEYRMSPRMRSSLMDKPYFQRIMGEVGRLNPAFDDTNYTVKNAVRLSYDSGRDKQNIVSLNTAIQHVGDLYDKIDKLDNTRFRHLNEVSRWLALNVSGDPRFKDFETTALAVAEETSRMLKGASPTLEEIRSWEDKFNSTYGPDVLKQVAKNALELMEKRLNAQRENYISQVGVPPSKRFVFPTAKKALKKVGLNPDEWDKPMGFEEEAASESEKQLPTIRSQKEYDALPSKSKFLGKDGKVYTKP